MALIVGLGNPGPEYEGTRHNIGYEVIDTLSGILSIPIKPEHRLFYMGQGHFKGERVTLLKPATFMNRSGKAVRHALSMTGDPGSQCLICYDDIHLPAGKIRLRPSGGAGGHNGISDIIEQLQHQDFPRLRIGIGNDFSRGHQADYVLSPFTPEQRKEIDQTLKVASDAILTFLLGGVNLAMNKFN